MIRWKSRRKPGANLVDSGCRTISGLNAAEERFQALLRHGFLRRQIQRPFLEKGAISFKNLPPKKPTDLPKNLTNGYIERVL